MGKYRDGFDSFLSTYTDLISEYEMIDSVIPFEYCEEDIESAFNNVLKLDKSIKYQNALLDALNYSIKYNVNIIEGFDMLISSISMELQSNNSIQQYFKEINDIYNKHNNVWWDRGVSGGNGRLVVRIWWQREYIWNLLIYL